MIDNSTSTEAPSYTTLLFDARLLSLLIISFVGMFNATVVSPVIPSIAEAFTVSDAQIGLVMSVYTLPGILFVLLLGTLADIYGRRLVLLLSLFLLGCSGVAIVIADTFTTLLVLRVIQGIGGAVVMPLTAALIGDLYDGVASSTAHGLRASINGVSMLVMPVTVGFLVGFSWRYAFLLYAGALGAMLIAFVFLPGEMRSPRVNSSVTEALRQYVASAFSEFRTATHGVLVFGGLIRGFTLFAVLTFVPLYAARVLDASPFVIGLIVSMRGAARVLVAPFTGAVLVATSHRLAIATSLLFAAVCVLLLPVAPNVYWLGALVMGYSAGDSLFFPVQQDAITSIASDDHRAGMVSSASFLRKVGATVAPVTFGAILALRGFSPIFAVASLVLVGYVVMVLRYW